MSWLLSYYTRQGFHVVSIGNVPFMVFNIQTRSKENCPYERMVMGYADYPTTSAWGDYDTWISCVAVREGWA